MPSDSDLQQQSIRDAQAMMDKATNYSRLVMTVGYGGFIALWVGGKQYLSPKHLMLSGLLLMISAFLFIAYQVVEVAGFSHINKGLARVVGADESTRVAKAQVLVKTYKRVGLISAIAWPPIYYVCVFTGFGGMLILMWGFGRALWAMR